MTKSYSASLNRRNLLKQAGAAGLGLAAAGFVMPTGALAQAGPPLRGRFAPGGDYLVAQPGLAIPDQIDLGGGFMQRLEFYDRDNKPFVMSNFRGQVTMLQFWHTNCHGCQAEVPALDKLAGEMRGEKFQVIPIALSQDSLSEIENFNRRKGVKHTNIYRDRTSLVFNNLAPAHPRYNAQATPTTILVDPRGNAIGAYVGVAGWERADGRALIDYYVARA